MSESQNRRPNPVERVDFICKTHYGNQLPDLPFEPKFLEAPFTSLNRFVDYKPTSLEKNYKYELLTEPDLNVKIDLIDPMTYFFDPNNRPPLHPKDEKLLEDESVSQQNFKRSLQHSKVVPFMRKTEYISTEFNRFGVGAERQEARVGYGMRKKFAAEQVNYKDRDSQIAVISRTFEDVKKPVEKHYSKPGVVAIAEMPIFPDFDMWGFPFAQVIFDADPLPLCKEHREEKLSQAVLRGMMDGDGNHFVGYFSPTEAAIAQKAADATHEEEQDENVVVRDHYFKLGYDYEHKLEREYTWTVKNKATVGYEQENYFFVIRCNSVFYNELDSRVRLVRRLKSQSSRKWSILLNKKSGVLFGMECLDRLQPFSNSILTTNYHKTNSRENKIIESRIRRLLYPLEEEEDEPALEDEEEPEAESAERQEEKENDSDAEEDEANATENLSSQRAMTRNESASEQSSDEDADEDDASSLTREKVEQDGREEEESEDESASSAASSPSTRQRQPIEQRARSATSGNEKSSSSANSSPSPAEQSRSVDLSDDHEDENNEESGQEDVGGEQKRSSSPASSSSAETSSSDEND